MRRLVYLALALMAVAAYGEQGLPASPAVAPHWPAGQVFVWGYYPGGGARPRMYEAYVQLPERRGYPAMAMLTLFPDEEPRGTWVLHDGIGFDYAQTVAMLADPERDPQVPVQMYTYVGTSGQWWPSTRHPNTLAHLEKFNYRAPFVDRLDLPTASLRACYDGQQIAPLAPSTQDCTVGDMVVQYRPRSSPSYVYWPYYSVKTGITLFKQFNDDASDPDAFVAMRLVYVGQQGQAIHQAPDEYFLTAYRASLVHAADRKSVV